MLPNLSPLLEIQDITKEFPGVKALDNVSLAVNRGEVMALLGENGAGKSTLVKILSGAYIRDSGTIRISGQELPKHYKPLDARKLGIAIIYQELSLLPNLSVAENIYLTKEPLKSTWLRTIDYWRMNELARAQLAKLKADYIPVRVKVHTLSLPEKQMVEIAKALAVDCRVIIMDEPTTTLTWEETQRLFNVIQALKEQDVTIIYISHRLDEIFRIVDRAVILRDGQVVGDLKIDETDMIEVIALMTGRSLSSFTTADVVKHTQRLKGAIAKKPDALIVSCLDAAADKPLIEEAVSQGIPVINFDTPCGDSPVQGFVGRFDCTGDGAEVAEALAAAINYQGKVAILAGSPGAANHQQRVKGFKQAMAQYLDITIVAEEFDNDNLERAVALTRSIIQANPDLAGVFGANASAPIGAGRAILEAGKSDGIVLIGMDDLPEMVEFVRDGTALAMSVQDVRQIGYWAIQYAVATVDGRPIPTIHDTGSRLVTADQVDTYKSAIAVTTADQVGTFKSAVAAARDSYHFVFVPKLAHPWYDAVQQGADEAVAEFAARDIEVSYDWDAPQAARDGADSRKELLRVEEYGDGGLLANISFVLRENEVLGIAGLVGAGRTELARLIFAADQKSEGRLFISGRAVGIRSPGHAVRQGIGYLSENRKEEGLNLGLKLEDNIVITDFGAVSQLGVTKKSAIRIIANSFIDRIRIKGRPETLVMTLSGGNQQKVAISKWVHAGCKVLIFDEPTRGIDVGAKAEIHSIIREFATQGRGAVVISSEVEELLDICDRILVMSKGRLVKTLEGNDMTKEILLKYTTEGA